MSPPPAPSRPSPEEPPITPPPPIDFDLQRFDRELEAALADRKAILIELDSVHGDARGVRARLEEANERLERLSKLADLRDKIAFLRLQTGASASLTNEQAEEYARQVRKLTERLIPVAERVSGAYARRQDRVKTATENVSRALGVDPSRVRVTEDPADIGAWALRRLVPEPPAVPSAIPVIPQLMPPLPALQFGIPVIPEKGSKDWKSLGGLKDWTERLRGDLRRTKVELENLRQKLAYAERSLVSKNIENLAGAFREAKAATESLEKLRVAVNDTSGFTDRLASLRRDVWDAIASNVVMDFAGKAKGDPEELWLRQRLVVKPVQAAVVGIWDEASAAFQRTMVFRTPSGGEVARWLAEKTAIRGIGLALRQLPAGYAQSWRAARFGKFYADEVRKVLGQATESITAAARASAFGSVDEMQAIADRAEGIPLKIEKDSLQKVTGFPLDWFVGERGEAGR